MIKLHPKLFLDGLKLSKALLLSNCPRLTNISLKELACKKEVVGLNMRRANVEVIAKVFIQGDKLSEIVLLLLIFLHLVANPRVPTYLPSGKKEDIVQGRIKRVRIRNFEELLMLILPVNNDVLRASDMLPITNYNNSNLLYSGIRKIVATVVTI